MTILELAMSLAGVCLLLTILLPALASARQASAKERCAGHLRAWGAGWGIYLAEHDGSFPYVPVQPAWHYAGVRFSADGPCDSKDAFPNVFVTAGPLKLTCR